jgi:hypothetical protein
MFYLFFIILLNGQPVHGVVPFDTEKGCINARKELMQDFKSINPITGMPISQESQIYCFKNEQPQ